MAAESRSSSHPTRTQSYSERASQPGLTPLAAYLLQLMHLKRTNLCVSADVTTTRELLRIAHEVGDDICILKTHADIISDFGARTIHGLNEIARRKKFLVFEDRKFGDIGNTVQQQYVGGPLTIVRWAPIVNCHVFPGPAIISALSQAAAKAITAHNTSVQTDIRASPALSAVDSGRDLDDLEDDRRLNDDADDNNNTEAEVDLDDTKERKASVVSVSTTISMNTESISPPPGGRSSFSFASGNADSSSVPVSHSPDLAPSDAAELERALDRLGPPPFYRSLLLLAQMSSANNYFTPAYTAACLTHAREHRDFVMGFIAQESLNTAPDDNFITMTPGVQLSAGGDGLGQQYNTPAKVITEAGTDVIIVGRGIIAAQDRAAAAHEYKKQGWAAYEKRLQGR